MFADPHKPTILIVEDEIGPRNALQVILRPFYNLQSVENGQEALSVLRDEKIDLITLDMKLPDQHGLDLLQRVKSAHQDVEVIVITGYGSLQSAMDSIRYGAAAYLLKPFNVTELLAIISQTLNKKQRLESLRQFLRSNEGLWGSEEEAARSWKVLAQQYQDIRSRVKGDTSWTECSDPAPLLSELLEAYDADLFNHSHRTSFYAALLGKQLKLTEGERKALALGALLHDVGSLAFGKPLNELYQSQRGRQQLRQHPEIGARMVLPLGLAAEVGQIILYHHERYDGTGYPYGLQGEGIPLLARIVSIAQAFDHLTADHPSRQAVPVEDALARITRLAGSRFDPKLTDLLKRVAHECATSLPALAASARHSTHSDL
ncbi:HD domain-containing phosphohydrolase [Candidatus Nitrospira bockiana]